MFISHLLVIFSAVAIGISTPTARSSDQIVADGKQLAVGVSTMDQSCDKFIAAPGLSTALVFDTAGKDVAAAAQKCVSEINATPGPLSSSQCDAIFTVFHGLKNFNLALLAKLARPEVVADFQHLQVTGGAGPLVSARLTAFRAQTAATIKGLTTLCSSLADVLKSDGNVQDAAFAATIKLY
ncbi:hypothetical protein C8J57DRAFT_484474 [Mycena rebaudengoi]|nr:hypothetical protein C8J57DRAFT_484474 [Mycena rebaudengoi]